MTDKTEFYSTPAERQRVAIESVVDFGFELPRKHKVPSIEHAAEVAMDLRTRFIHDATPIAIVESFVEQNKMGLKYENLADPNAHGTTRIRHQYFGPVEFNIVINNQNNDRWLEEFGDLSDVHAAVIGHEIAHTLFYIPNKIGH